MAKYFKSPSDFRQWLAAHHARARELQVGFYKKDSGRPSITWEESIDQALCFGWIDGVRKRVDEIRYTIRFTPRKASSNWSRVNIRRVNELSRRGLMEPAGIEAFARRDQKKTKLYSYENEGQELDPLSKRKFRANQQAWKYFQAQAPSYRKVAYRWVMGARQAETKAKRLAILIKDSENNRRLGFTTQWSKKQIDVTDPAEWRAYAESQNKSRPGNKI